MEYDESFFTKVLRNYYKDPTIKVHSVDDESAANEEIGEHFMSEILRYRVKFARSSFSVNETQSFFLKCEPDSIFLKMIRREQLFNVETRVLRDIIPRIESALGIRLGPKFIHGETEPQNAILMEDLSSDGFCIKNNKMGLSMAHATMAIQNLARFHAGSVMLSEEVTTKLL